MLTSQQQEQQNDNQESFLDQNAIQTLKQEVCLSNHQLLQLTYNDEKFYMKLKQLNHFGCLHIQKAQYPEALIYLNEAEKVLEYAASCGKTIQRKLIITTLNNQASLYQKAWELQKAQSYLEAIIYNISSFFQNSQQQQPHSHPKSPSLTKNILDQASPEYQDFSISLWRKKSLVIFYLQYCAINSQNKNNERAFSSASKAVNLIKEIAMDLWGYEKYVKQNGLGKEISQEEELYESMSEGNFLEQLAMFKEIDMKNADFQVFYKKTVKYIALYMKRLQPYEASSEQNMQTYRTQFENYSIGTIMQINPVQLDQQKDKVDLNHQISILQKHFKAIYLSVGHFILGTQSRFIAAQKYTLDQNQRKSSQEYKQSQIYHLCSIIILTKFLLCESGYFDHIVNSFRNHYKIDIMEDARKYLENNEEQIELHDDSLFFCEQKKEVTHHVQMELIEKLESQIKTTQQIQEGNNENRAMFNLNTEESQEICEGPITPKDKGSGTTKSTKNSKNTVNGVNTGLNPPNTATKKSHNKKPSTNHLTKSQARLQTHQGNRIMTASQHQNKNLQKPLHLVTSRQKQNKLKQTTHHPPANTKSSRSKRKSDYQFLASQKKINLGNNKPQVIDKVDTKRETIYSKRESDYVSNVMSKSKNKRIPTSAEADKKNIRRKDSIGDLKKTKKVEEQYGISNKVNEAKTSRNNLNINTNQPNALKRSKNRKQSEDKIKLTSPQIKLKKLKSPRNLKK